MSTVACITTSASNMCRHLSNVIRTAIANCPIEVFIRRTSRINIRLNCFMGILYSQIDVRVLFTL